MLYIKMACCCCFGIVVCFHVKCSVITSIGKQYRKLHRAQKKLYSGWAGTCSFGPPIGVSHVDLGKDHTFGAS
ncbi:hypothetical protein DFH11DRAFT_1614211 [Phellopilus nigrolimitatus]|nr:hypothetical protein DFH11DRAFT_1614210 [Phellopilus nigrolimitatus]KAH8111268.1 hypothetical protein DFH11DRAFT_1614211 [Phellopilus nigrolimitatus]